MKSKHTPGPWKHNKDFFLYEKDHYNEILASDSNGKGFSIRAIISDADAKLIAAAPDLLEALNSIVTNIEKWLETGEPATDKESKELYDTAKKAIKKAI